MSAGAEVIGSWGHGGQQLVQHVKRVGTHCCKKRGVSVVTQRAKGWRRGSAVSSTLTLSQEDLNTLAVLSASEAVPGRRSVPKLTNSDRSKYCLQRYSVQTVRTQSS